MRSRLLLLLLVAGCDESPAPPDAPAIAENGITACGKPVVFIETNGVTLAPAAVDDATLDQSFLQMNRERPIEPIADRVRADAILEKTLAEFADLSIPATQTRPTSAPYVMIAIDGDVTGWENIRSVTGIAPIDCADEVASNIALVNLAAHDVAHTAQLATSIQFVLGTVVGLDPVNGRPRNCMNFRYPVDDCVFEDAVATYMDVAQCAPGASQDQRTLVAERLACP